jgi:signal transduction histidine kinase
MASQRHRHHLSADQPATSASESSALADLRRVEQAFEDCPWPERRAFTKARKRAHEHALHVLAGGSDGGRARAALLAAAADLTGALAVELAASPREAARLVSRLERIGLPRAELAREVLRAPDVLALLPGVAVKAELAMLMAFAPLRGVSLWTRDRGERIRCAAHLGDGPSRGAQQLAKRLLAGETVESGARRLLLGIPIGRSQQPVGALIGSANPGERDLARALLAEAAPLLAALLRRDIQIAETAAAEQALIEASERKLVRLGFDLHDGPIQDLAALADDLRLFRDQLELELGPLDERKLVSGRIEDLEAQLGALDGELRRLSNEVQAASVLLNRPFRAALRERVQAFAARTGIRPRLTVAGDMNLLSTSQQIALLNIIQEALSNVREHAQASTVEITLSSDDQGVEAKVTDDGRGFELEPTLMRAAREGRIGLLAMNERVRLLGGECRIESRSGGPTEVTVALKRWRSLQQEPRGAGQPGRQERRSRDAQPSATA